MDAKSALGPTPPARSVAAEATMIKFAETDSWVMSEAEALLPVVKEWPPP